MFISVERWFSRKVIHFWLLSSLFTNISFCRHNIENPVADAIIRAKNVFFLIDTVNIPVERVHRKCWEPQGRQNDGNWNEGFFYRNTTLFIIHNKFIIKWIWFGFNVYSSNHKPLIRSTNMLITTDSVSHSKLLYYVLPIVKYACSLKFIIITSEFFWKVTS